MYFYAVNCIYNQKNKEIEDLYTWQKKKLYSPIQVV